MPIAPLAQQRIAGLALGAQAWSGKPTKAYFGLHRANEDGTFGPELSGLGYRRAEVTYNSGGSSNFIVDAATMTVSNRNGIDWPARATEDWPAVKFVAIHSALTGGSPLWYEACPEQIIKRYEKPNFPAGVISLGFGPTSVITPYLGAAILSHWFQALAMPVIPKHYWALGTAVDEVTLFGEPQTRLANPAAHNGYSRVEVANSLATYPATAAATPGLKVNAKELPWPVVSTGCDWTNDAGGSLLYAAIFDSDVKTAVYSQSGTTVTVTDTAHGLITGEKVSFFPRHGATAGPVPRYGVTITVTDANTYTLTSTYSGTLTSQSCRISRGNLLMRGPMLSPADASALSTIGFPPGEIKVTAA